jgi:hypothetical protein
MALLASVLAYLGAATGIAVALLMTTTVFLATPNRPAIRLQTLAMASRPSAPAATTNATTKPALGVGRWKPRAAFGQRVGLQTKGSAYTRPGFHAAKANLRKEVLDTLARLECKRRWANQQEPNLSR